MKRFHSFKERALARSLAQEGKHRGVCKKCGEVLHGPACAACGYNPCKCSRCKAP